MAKADMPDFTVREAIDIANMVVGRWEALASMEAAYPNMPEGEVKRLNKAIKELKPLADKLRPWYTGENS